MHNFGTLLRELFIYTSRCLNVFSLSIQLSTSKLGRSGLLATALLKIHYNLMHFKEH